jgi:hypothetical protein
LVCGAPACRCGDAHDDGTTIIDLPRRSTMPRGPLDTYRTHAGDFRLSEQTAKARGLVPDGDALPRAVRRRLASEARLNPGEVAGVAAAYAELSDGERAEALRALALTKPRQLRERAVEYVGAIEEAPTGPAAVLTGTIGDVLASLDAIDDEDRARAVAGELLEAERAGQARKSLVAELERRAGE